MIRPCLEAGAPFMTTSEPLSPTPLVVDLDGTLIATDSLYESFWLGLNQNWTLPFDALRALWRGGRTGVKAALEQRAPLDVSALPYRASVRALIDDCRAGGGHVVLATAADHALAQRVADHLGCFDAVIASAPGTNLKGAQKAQALEARFGPRGFTYVGDSFADLEVWRGAACAITVGASERLRAQAEAAAPQARHLDPAGPQVATWMRSIRAHQWLKNLLVFVPLLADHRFTGAALLAALLAFYAFGMIASAGYVLNDLMDLRADRAHPRKCARPIPSGTFGPDRASRLLPLLLILGFTIAALLGGHFALAMLVYFVTTVNYSIWIKELPIIDICVLAGLYTLRIIAGALAIGVTPSMWLLAFSMFFFFALAAVKRQAELVDMIERNKMHSARRGYVPGDLPVIRQIALSAGLVSVLVLALYITQPEVQARYSAPFLLWGDCAVMLYWTTRIALITHRGQMHDDPVVFAATNRGSQICFALGVTLTILAALV